MDKSKSKSLIIAASLLLSLLFLVVPILRIAGLTIGLIYLFISSHRNDRRVPVKIRRDE